MRESVLAILLAVSIVSCAVDSSSTDNRALGGDRDLNGWHQPMDTPLTADVNFAACGRAYQPGSRHLGEDIWDRADTSDDGSLGDPVYAIGDGRVVSISPGGWGDGNRAVLVQHESEAGSFVAVYGHLSAQSLGAIARGTSVVWGQRLGTLGPYPASWPHLHFGIRPGSGTPPGPYGSIPDADCSAPRNLNDFVGPYQYLMTYAPSNPGGCENSQQIGEPQPGIGVPDEAASAIANAYASFPGNLGCPYGENGGSPLVHELFGLYLQDFFQPNPPVALGDGHSAIIHSPGDSAAFVVHSGFWGTYKCLVATRFHSGCPAGSFTPCQPGGAILLGAPRQNERTREVDGITEQTFERGYMTWDGETIRVHLNEHDPLLVDWNAASRCVGSVVIHNPPEASPVDVDPRASVTPARGPRGTEFRQVATGLTPNGDITLNFRYPNRGTASLGACAGGDGSILNSWTAPPEAQIGEYAFWVVDDRTGTSSPEFAFWVTADCTPVAEICHDGEDNDCDGAYDGDDDDCPSCGDGTCEPSESYFDCAADCGSLCHRDVGSLIRDGSFDSELTCWIQEDHHDAAAFSTHSGGSDDPPSARIDVDSGGEVYEVQLAQNGISVVSGRTYRLGFAAKASSTRDIVVQLGRATEPYDGFGLYASRTLTTSWARHEGVFVATQTDTNAKLGLAVGDRVGSVWVDNVTLEDRGIVAYCGDGFCGPDESIENCADDCVVGCPRVAPNLLRDGGFDVNLSCWYQEDHDDRFASFDADLDTAPLDVPSARVTVESTGAIYQVQLGQRDVPVQAGVRYRLSFAARANSPRAIVAQLGAGSGDFRNYGLYASVEIGTGWASHSVEWDNDSTDSEAKFGFAVGDIVGSVWFDDVSIERVGPTPVCTDDCLASSARCVGETSVQVCGAFDDDDCLEWSPPTACSSGQCENGRCTTPCQDECFVAGQRCVGGMYLEICGEHDGDRCLEWGGATACPSGICVDDACLTPCSNECEVGEAECVTATAIRFCVHVDTDPCLHWGPGTPCASGRCDNNACRPPCFDDCGENERRCQNGVAELCGNYDGDPCLEWGGAAVCASGSCAGDVCAPHSCSCTDPDGDGYYAETCTDPLCEPRTDCDNSVGAVNPGATEICGNGRDDDCSGVVDDGCAPACTGAECEPFLVDVPPGTVSYRLEWWNAGGSRIRTDTVSPAGGVFASPSGACSATFEGSVAPNGAECVFCGTVGRQAVCDLPGGGVGCTHSGDCGFCGDSTCQSSESADTCPSDCSPDCNDDCARGMSECVNAWQQRTCDNFDSDPCMEWSVAANCASGVCSGGVCSDEPACGARELRISLTAAAQSECSGGWEIVVWNNLGVELPRSTPGGSFLYVLPASYACNGTLGFSAYCPGSGAWRVWTAWTNSPVSSAGIASVLLGGDDLTGDSLVCNFFDECTFGSPAYWTTPRVPLEPGWTGGCDVSPYACPGWCDGDDPPDPLCY